MKTVVIGASPNPSRYSHKAVNLLNYYNHEVVPVGIREGYIGDLKILIGKPQIESVHTVTLYIGKDKQEQYFDYLLSLKPKRIILNPGTENDVLIDLAEKNGIQTVENCTLVMLNSGSF